MTVVLTRNDSIGLICEALEVSIHQILYVRRLYPAMIFRPRKVYGIQVQMAIHPDVTDYLSQCTSAIKSIITDGDLDKIELILLDSQEKIVEKFVFDVAILCLQHDTDMETLEQNIREFCLKLSTIDAIIPPKGLDGQLSFRIRVHTNTSVLAQQSSVKIIHGSVPFLKLLAMSRRNPVLIFTDRPFQSFIRYTAECHYNYPPKHRKKNQM